MRRETPSKGVTPFSPDRLSLCSRYSFSARSIVYTDSKYRDAHFVVVPSYVPVSINTSAPAIAPCVIVISPDIPEVTIPMSISFVEGTSDEGQIWSLRSGRKDHECKSTAK